MINIRATRTLIASAIASAAVSSAFADVRTIYADDGAGHSSSAEFSLIGDYLQLVVTETSTFVPDEPVNSILSDIYFNLPTGVVIDSGNAKITSGSTVLNFDNAGSIVDGDISTEWGYTNDIDNGNIMPQDLITLHGEVTSGVTTRPNNASTMFTEIPPGTNYDGPDSLAGPQAGMVSDDSAVLAAFGTSQGAISNSITFQLWLADGDGSTTLENLDFLNNVIFEYGSDWLFTGGDDPEDPFDPVPEPGEYLMIMVGAFGLLYEYRRRKKASKA